MIKISVQFCMPEFQIERISLKIGQLNIGLLLTNNTLDRCTIETIVSMFCVTRGGKYKEGIVSHPE
jgi:hypothetical protein